MKTPTPTIPSNQPPTRKPNPINRISLAVRELDKLINRAYQLGSFTDQLLREDQTGPSLPSSEIDTALSTTSRSPSTDKKSNKQGDTPEKL